jgi:sec-independent protein translocase protein TatB
VNFSPEKLLLVGIIALVVLGPNRLPQAARTAGRLLAEFRRMSANLQNEVTQALAEPRDAIQQSVGEFGLTNVRSQLRNTINEVVTGPRPANGASDGYTERAEGAIEAANALRNDVGAPIVDPSQAIEVSAQFHSAPASDGLPLIPDDPSFN